jgi:hypothetical protein
VGPGDDLYFPGLFKHHKGTLANIPILRMGNIAAMPGELIDTACYGQQRAYLAEAHSIGGLSGSPVFIDLGLHRGGAGIVIRGDKSPGRVHFLGLIHGHFNSHGGADSVNDADMIGRLESTNSGIVIVIPGREIESVLDLPELRGRDLGAL